MNETIVNVSTPEVGKQYEFYDDGKITPSRRFTASVLEIISPEEAKTVMLPLYAYEESDMIPTTIIAKGEEPIGETSLYMVWEENLEEHDWLFAVETDYFIKCSVPKYDEYPIWFVRTIEGNWFSLDIQSHWQGGLLDIDNHLTEDLEQRMKEYNNNVEK